MDRGRPIVLMALAVLAGVLCGIVSPLDPWRHLLPACVLVGAVAVWLTLRGHRLAGLTSVAALFCAGALWGCCDSLEHQRLSLERLFAADTPRSVRLPVTITGRLASDVVVRDEGRLLTFDLHCRAAVTEDGRSFEVQAPVAVRLYGRSRLRPNFPELWSFQGALARDGRRSRTPYRFSTSVRGARRLDSGVNHWSGRCMRLRRRAASILAHDIEPYPAAVSVVQAMTLGYRDQLPRSVREVFARVGAAHVFAVSGLHVAMLVSMLVFLLAAVGVPRTRWLLFVLPLIVGYTVATGARPSAIRAGIMAVVFLSAPLLGRRGDGVASLALAAVLIALWNPQQLLDVGAIYSFTVVTGIMILYPVLMRRAAGLWERDPVDVTPEALLSRLSRRMCKVVMSLSVVASAAWISSIPLTAHYFGRISLVAVPCNLLVIPAAFLTLTSSMLALIASGVSTPLADLFNNANAALVTMLLGVLRPLAALSWSCLDVPSIPIWCIPAWYVAVWGGALALRRSD